MSFILYDYQEEIVSRVIASYQQNKSGRELVVLGTGGGKTICFSEVIHRLNIPTLLLAHRDTLLDQAADKYRETDPTAIIGKVCGSVNELGGMVTCASVQTAYKPKRLKELASFNYPLIIVDEAHHAPSASYQTVLNAFPDAFILFVTATPKRLDKKPIIKGKEPIFDMGLKALIKIKRLCSPRAIAIRTEVSLDEIKTLGGDYNEGQLEKAIDTPLRNKRIVDAYIEHGENRLTIGFCVTVLHAQSLCYTFNDAGIASAYVTGESTTVERNKMYGDLATGVIRCLFSVQVLTEGFDLPAVSCIIMARPTQSESLFLQCIGRGSRLSEGKKDFLILDITDNCTKHKISPRTINNVLHIEMQDGETIKEAEARIVKEAEEKEIQERKLKEKREKDLQINLLQDFNWQKRENDGAYFLTFGKDHHKIGLKPEKRTWIQPAELWDMTEFEEEVQLEYSTWVQWNGIGQAVKQVGALPLTEALARAETLVHRLVESPAILTDKNAAWRSNPVTDAQRQMLMWKRIEYREGMTSGEAADLIQLDKDEKAARKLQKEKNRMYA